MYIKPTLVDFYIAEYKLRLLSEKQDTLVFTTIWKSTYILMIYNISMQMLAPLEWIDESKINEEDYTELIKIIKKFINKA